MTNRTHKPKEDVDASSYYFPTFLEKMILTNGSMEQINSVLKKDKPLMDYDSLLFVANELDYLGIDAPVEEFVKYASDCFERIENKNHSIENLILGIAYKSPFPKNMDSFKTTVESSNSPKELLEKLFGYLILSTRHFSNIDESEIITFADRCLYDYESDVLYDHYRMIAPDLFPLVPNGWALIKWLEFEESNVDKMITIVLKSIRE